MKSKIIDNIQAITPHDWDRCALQGRTGFNPFCSHGFLSALESSGCVNASTGWLPQHMVLENDQNDIIGVMPLYLKHHSQGEFVFDHAWAQAFENAGGHYYPKLQCSIPFSPVTGPRLMINPEVSNKNEAKKKLLSDAIAHAEKCGVSSAHFTFLENDEADLMKSCGLLIRHDQQFHWVNNEYKSFEDFLSSLSSRKRKNIIKERNQAVQNDIEIEVLKKGHITEDHWDHYFHFYLDTSNKKWGRPYLNRKFFSLLSDRIGDNLVLIMAKRNNQYIAGALNLVGNDVLFGRYWGAIENHRFLHFEVCYYQAIDYAIKNNLLKVEAGAQGEHKISRGYQPTVTQSAHWIANPSFKGAVKNFLDQERIAVQQNIDYLRKFEPFKKP
jgi:uncharacterized protein